MNLIWPVFHDPSYKPSLRDRFIFHWQANLRMLRKPRDIILFNLISFAPLALVVTVQVAFPGLFSVTYVPGSPVPDLTPVIFTMMVTFLVALVLQHLAFVLALNLTYVPHVREVLRDRGVPVCLQCAHLKPPLAPGSGCPECGAGQLSATMSDSSRRTSNDDDAAPDSEDPPR